MSGPLDGDVEEDGGGEGYYLFWALFGGALVLAFGSTAILSKMAERPDLAAADPLMASLLKVACYGAWSATPSPRSGRSPQRPAPR